MAEKAKAQSRQQRLARALRENLKRRKARARGRESGASVGESRASTADGKNRR